LLGQARQNNTSIIVSIINIDHFKRSNDGYGHNCGDAVLKIFSDYLVEKCTDSMIACIGGEEFCLLMPGVEASKCNELLESIRTGMHDLPMSWHNNISQCHF